MARHRSHARTVLAIALVAVGVACTHTGSSAPVRTAVPLATPGRVVEIDMRTGAVLRDLEVGPDPLLAVPAPTASGH